MAAPEVLPDELSAANAEPATPTAPTVRAPATATVAVSFFRVEFMVCSLVVTRGRPVLVDSACASVLVTDETPGT